MNSLFHHPRLWLSVLCLFISHVGNADYSAVMENPEHNTQEIVSQRLIGRPIFEEGFQHVQDALNHKVRPEIQMALKELVKVRKPAFDAKETNSEDGTFLNCCLYENGERKPEGWYKTASASKIKRMHQNGELSWRLFYTKGQDPKFVAAVGGYLDKEGTLELCWLAHPDFQQNHYMSEAMRAFLKGDLFRLPLQGDHKDSRFVKISCPIHPDNKASRSFAKHVLGLNSDKTLHQSCYTREDQKYINQRLLYETSYADFTQVLKGLEGFQIGWQESGSEDAVKSND
jgi:RimJ/RimL family protein N-acetyltransferase